MAGIELRYFDTLTNNWVAPLANGIELQALNNHVDDLRGRVETAETNVAQTIQTVNGAVAAATAAAQVVQSHLTDHLDILVTENSVPVAQRKANTYYHFIKRIEN